MQIIDATFGKKVELETWVQLNVAQSYKEKLFSRRKISGLVPHASAIISSPCTVSATSVVTLPVLSFDEMFLLVFGHLENHYKVRRPEEIMRGKAESNVHFIRIFLP